MLKGLDTSAIKYVSAQQGTATSSAGSSGASDFSAFTFATLIVSTGSTAAATVTVDVLRSSASNGTFHNFGASVSTNVLGALKVRSFVLGSSDVWYKTYHTVTGAGSPGMVEIIALAGTREAPVDQETDTTSYSVINSA